MVGKFWPSSIQVGWAALTLHWKSNMTLYVSCVAEDGQLMYSGSSVVGKASLIDPAISPPLSLFSQGPKSAKFGVIFDITKRWATRVWKCSKISQLWKQFQAAIIGLCPRQVWRRWVHATMRAVRLKCPTPYCTAKMC